MVFRIQELKKPPKVEGKKKKKKKIIFFYLYIYIYIYIYIFFRLTTIKKLIKLPNSSATALKT